MEAEDAQRILLSALNGLAGLMLIEDDRAQAVALYRQVHSPAVHLSSPISITYVTQPCLPSKQCCACVLDVWLVQAVLTLLRQILACMLRMCRVPGRQVLATAEANKALIRLDPLQKLHTLSNLAELLAGGVPGVPHTLRDDSLATEADKIREVCYFITLTPPRFCKMPDQANSCTGSQD